MGKRFVSLSQGKNLTKGHRSVFEGFRVQGKNLPGEAGHADARARQENDRNRHRNYQWVDSMEAKIPGRTKRRERGGGSGKGNKGIFEGRKKRDKKSQGSEKVEEK